MTDVVTALAHRWESSVAPVLERVPGVTIARRCADVAELLSVVEAGVGRAAVVSSDLRGLDLEVVARLQARGVRVVGLHPSDDEPSERRLRQLGIAAVLSVEATGADLAAAIDAPDGRPDDVAAPSGTVDPFADLVVDSGGGQGPADGRPRALPGSGSGESALVGPGEPAGEASGPAGDRGVSRSGDDDDGDDPATPRGWRPSGIRHRQSRRGGSAAGDAGDGDGGDETGEPAALEVPERATVVAVWGPTGAPGRTTIATSLSAELAGRGAEVLLIDADTYGGCVAQALGLLDEAPGIAAACRGADQGTLDVPALARLSPFVTDGLRVLTGLPKAQRWPEVRGGALERVLELSRSLVPVVVVDCGFCLENDEELSYDTAAPRRNEATLTTLANADLVVVVSGADPIALQRLVRGLQELGSVPSPEPLVVVNRVRSAAVGSGPQARIAESLLRFAGLESVRFVPDDPATVDGAVLAGRSVVEHAPDSAVRGAVSDLASELVPWTRSRAAVRQRRWARTRAPARS